MEGARILLLIIITVYLAIGAGNSAAIPGDRSTINYPLPANDPDAAPPPTRPYSSAANHSRGVPYQYKPNPSYTISIRLTRNVSPVDEQRMIAPEINYYGAIRIGTPPRKFNVMFDLVNDKILLPMAKDANHTSGYNCSISSTCVPKKGNEITFAYRDMALLGKEYQDLSSDHREGYIQVPRQDGPLKVKYRSNCTVNLVVFRSRGAVDKLFGQKPYDGVVGMAPVPVASTGSVMNILLLLKLDYRHKRRYYLENRGKRNSSSDNAGSSSGDSTYVQKHVDEYEELFYTDNHKRWETSFSIWLNPNKSSSFGGELVLGGADEDRYMGDIFYHRSINRFNWEVRLSGVQVGGQVVSCAKGCTATLDSGVSSFFGPRDDVEQIYSLLNARHEPEGDLWVVDCNRTNEYPQLVFRLEEDVPYIVFPRHYINKFDYAGGTVCYIAIETWFRPGWKFGTNFLSAYYTVFDSADRRVGFATPRLMLGH